MESNNLVAEYETLDDALKLVLRGIERNGERDTETLALEVENEQGDVSTVATGQALAELARQERRMTQ